MTDHLDRKGGTLPPCWRIFNRGNLREVVVSKGNYNWKEVRNILCPGHQELLARCQNDANISAKYQHFGVNIDEILLEKDQILFDLCNNRTLLSKQWDELLYEEMTDPDGATTVETKNGVMSYFLDFLHTFNDIINEELRKKIYLCEFKREDIENYIREENLRCSGKPDRNHWYRQEFWTFWDTVWILQDIDPRRVRKLGIDFSSSEVGYKWFKEKTLSEFGLSLQDQNTPENLSLLFSIYESGDNRGSLFKTAEGEQKIEVIPGSIINYLRNHKNVAVPDSLKPLGGIFINDTDDSTPQEREPKEERNNQPESVNSFISTGGVWTVTYNSNKPINLKRNDRIKYIAYLLSTPGKEWDYAELYNLVGGKSCENGHWKKVKQTFKSDRNSKNDDDKVAESISNSPQLSEEDKQLYKDTINHSFNDLQNAIREEPEKIPNLQLEYEKIRKYLENEHGATVTESDQGVKVSFRNRLNLEGKRPYDAVRKQISDAIKQIKKEGLAELGNHLDKYIKKSNRYQPPLDYHKWDVKM